MSGLKSSYEIAMEKIKNMDIDNAPGLSEEQKKKINEIRNEYKAKIAEKKILLCDAAELSPEISFLERECSKKIESIKNL